MNSLALENLESQFDTADIFPVISRYPADLITPVGAYMAIAEQSGNSFLFESVEGGESLARYSFLGSNPELVFGNTESATVIDKLKTHLDAGIVARVEGLPAFVGGAVGFVEFSEVQWSLPILRNSHLKTRGTPQSRFMLFKRVIAFDHAKLELMIISLVFKRDVQGSLEFEQKLEKAYEENQSTADLIFTTGPVPSKSSVKESRDEPVSNWTKPDFLAAVDEIKEMILDGDVYQVVLSQCFNKKTDASPTSIYRALRSLNPSPYMFLLQFGSRSLVGASPEMLLRCTGDELEYRPIAGTRPRNSDSAKDKMLSEEMLSDKKEVSEHTMLVDLGRNDLGKVSRFGTVKVRDLMSVEKFSHVQHLVSYLSSKLDPACDRFEAFESCFPAGTVSGAPKVSAIEKILSMEPTDRGAYSGAVGYFDFAGNLDTCIAIRTLDLEDGIAKVQAGAGIVADSVPEAEFEETLFKAAGLFRAIELAETGKYGL